MRPRVTQRHLDAIAASETAVLEFLVGRGWIGLAEIRARAPGRAAWEGRDREALKTAVARLVDRRAIESRVEERQYQVRRVP